MPHEKLYGSRIHSLARSLGRLIWCGAGAATALGLVLWLVNPPSTPLLIASFGGSTVFLFGLTRAPAAQPRLAVKTANTRTTARIDGVTVVRTARINGFSFIRELVFVVCAAPRGLLDRAG
jgi:CBS-domain-containing membrane protein